MEPFTLSPDRHYVGADGFVVPRNFGEFFARDPLRVRRWLTKRLRGRFGEDTLLDLEQDLLVYLCALPTNSGFRKTGTNQIRGVCTDVIECFDPARHFGASAARFHNFVNLCLANRLNTILARRRLDPLFNLRNLTIANVKVSQDKESGPQSVGEIDEAYLLRHSVTFASESRWRTRTNDPVLKVYIGEFEGFVRQEQPRLLAVIGAIQQTASLRDAERSVGMGDREFQRSRRDLFQLRDRFLAERRTLLQKRQPSPSWETPMQPATKVFLREELYERVWTTPMYRLAKEFGYSDVGLAKVCEKHNIPRPELGYWRRIELGHKPERTPLPVVEQPNPYRIEIAIRERNRSHDRTTPTEVPAIPVSPDRPLAHPVVVRSERLLRSAKKDDSGILVPRTGTASHLRVTEAALARGLRILDAFFVALESGGMQIVWPKEENASLEVVGEGEKIGFALEEILDRKAHRPTEQEEARHKRDYWWSPPKWDYQATGLLRISLLNSETTGVRRTWSERKERSLESQLGAVVLGIVTLVASIKEVKVKRQRWHDEWEARRKREEEARREHEEFLRRGEVIRKAAQALHESQLVRKLAVCLGQSPHLHKLPFESFQQMQGILEWCSEYADRLDPTCHPDELVADFCKTR